MDKILDKLLIPFKMRFDKELEDEFVLLRNGQTNQNVRIITFSFIICIFIYYGLDTENIVAITAIKYALPLTVFGFIASYVPGNYRHGHFIVALFSTIIQLTIFWFTVTHAIKDVSDVRYFFIVAFVFAHYFGLQMLFIPALVSGGFCFFGMILIMQITYPELITHAIYILITCHLLGASVCYRIDATERDNFLSLRGISEERKKTENLIHRVLPEKLAGVLSTEEVASFSSSSSCSVMFVKINVERQNAKPEDYQEIFKVFDRIVTRSNLQKIKTYKNIYILSGGIFSSDQQLEELLLTATEFRLECLKIKKRTRQNIEFKAGISSGVVSHGVIGKRTFAFDIWGSPVNKASRIMSLANEGQIVMDYESTKQLDHHFKFRPPFSQNLKGFDEVEICSFIRVDFEQKPEHEVAA